MVTFDIFRMFLVIVASHYSVNCILTRFLSPRYVFNINRRLWWYDLSIKINVFCGRNISWKLFKLKAFKLLFFSKISQLNIGLTFSKPRLLKTVNLFFPPRLHLKQILSKRLLLKRQLRGLYLLFLHYHWFSNHKLQKFFTILEFEISDDPWI